MRKTSARWSNSCRIHVLMILRSSQRSSRARRLGLPLCAVLLFGLAGEQAAEAQTTPSAEDKAGARATAERATAAFKDGRYAEAIDLFQRAEALFHAPTHVLMMARSYAASGKLVLAKESYLAVTREELAPKAPPAFKKAQNEAEKELKDLEPRIPSLEVSAALAGGKKADTKNLVITMDGKPVPAALIGIPKPADPGAHVLVATADGFASPEKTITLKEGEKATLVLELSPAKVVKNDAPAGGTNPTMLPVQPAPETPDTPAGKTSGLRYAGIGLMGAGVVGLGVGGVFMGLSFSKRADADAAFNACGAGCFGPDADQVRAIDADANQKGNIAIIGLAAGGALAATGVVLFVMGGQKGKANAPAAMVTPYVGPTGGGFVGRF